MRTTFPTLLATACLALSLAHCGAPEDNSFTPEEDNTRQAEGAASLPTCRLWGGRATTLTQDAMNHLYYDVNWHPHAEAAYQPADPAPPVSQSAAYADPLGRVTVLQTSLYNRDGVNGVRYGATARFAVYTRNRTPLCAGEGTIPFRYDLPDMNDGDYYYIQPLTLSTQAKALPTVVAR